MSHEAIYDAALKAFDISHIKARAHEAIGGISWQWQRPSVLMRPRIFIDGNQWCALYGENLQDGVAGFGDSPDAAMCAFDAEWVKKLDAAGGAT
jgi:hypothetical protein